MSHELTNKIWIGTSNVVVPGNKASFPEAFQSVSRLHYYNTLFNSVEINSSFYKTPLLSTYTKWALDVADDFRFSIKLSKEITHAKELKCELEGISKFINSATGLGAKKGCLLIQFPGKITIDYFKQVEDILQQLATDDASGEWRKAVEFRNNSWYIAETYELLNEFNAAMVLHDIPKSKNTGDRGKAAFVYNRFHGPKGDYREGYSDQFLQTKANEAKDWMAMGKEVFMYFNNTIGDAFDNARFMRTIIEKGVDG